MTREEAIKIIDCYDIGFYDLSGAKIPADKLADAFDMAIEALSAEAVTHGRLIDADALSEKLCETTIFIKDGEVFQRMINDAPTVSAEAVQGEWILVKGSNGKDYHKCSKCLHTQEITGVKNYCAVCGTRMKGGGDE